MAQGHNDIYTNISNRLSDVVKVAGSAVTDLKLDLANRAQRSLWEYAFWDDLLIDAALTVAADRTASLPSDYGKMLSVWWDSNSDSKPDYYFYRDGKVPSGFKIRSIFVKATGHAYTITFFFAPQNTTRILYQKTLPDFTTGADFSFFPAELVVREALSHHYADLGSDKLEANLAIRDKLLKDFVQGHQYLNTEMEQTIKDMWGNEIFMPVSDLSGMMDFSPRSRTMPPSYDNG